MRQKVSSRKHSRQHARVEKCTNYSKDLPVVTMVFAASLTVMVMGNGTVPLLT